MWNPRFRPFRKFPYTFLILGFVFSGALLSSCGDRLEVTDSAPQSCDFTQKLTSIAIDEQSELLYDEDLIRNEQNRLWNRIQEEERQRQEQETLINQALPEKRLSYHEPLSKKGRTAYVKLDLIRRLEKSSKLSEKKQWLTLYNHLRWGELVTDRSFLQECTERIVLKSDPHPYEKQAIEAYFMDPSIESIAQRNLYYAYATPEEIDYLMDSSHVYRFIHTKSERGKSTGFFVKDVNRDTEWKVKIGWESYREPLATHLAWGLGFPVDEVFHVRELRVEYTEVLEQLFEGHARRLEDSLSAIHLKDGTTISLIATAEYQPEVQKLYQQNRKHIQYLMFKEVVLERRDPKIVRVGSWSFDALGNPELRAVRLLGLLHYWLGNEDIKYDNNRILLKCDNPDCSGNYQYQFVVHDLGLAFEPHPNQFSIGFDIQQDTKGAPTITIPTRQRDVSAWYQTTQQDVLAFIERLKQLNKKQLRQAAAAAGYPYPALVLVVEKIASRSNYFIEKMTGQRGNLSENFNQILADDGEVDVGSRVITVPQDGFVLEKGELTNDISLGFHGRHSEMIRE
ncbi:hypothetical protein WDW89_22275 [Deltaproteobacteria bacterium TL4]